MFNVHVGLDEPAEYVIKVQGRLNDDLSDWFQGPVSYLVETIKEGEAAGDTVTALTGTITDQAALHGLLRNIRDLGLTLLFVDCLTAHSSKHDQ